MVVEAREAVKVAQAGLFVTARVVAEVEPVLFAILIHQLLAQQKQLQ